MKKYETLSKGLRLIKFPNKGPERELLKLYKCKKSYTVRHTESLCTNRSNVRIYLQF